MLYEKSTFRQEFSLAGPARPGRRKTIAQPFMAGEQGQEKKTSPARDERTHPAREPRSTEATEDTTQYHSRGDAVAQRKASGKVLHGPLCVPASPREIQVLLFRVAFPRKNPATVPATGAEQVRNRAEQPAGRRLAHGHPHDWRPAPFDLCFR